MKIKKKTWMPYFKDLIDGKKTFDVRLNNFDCKVGDILILEEYDQKNKKYTGRYIEKEITFVLNTKTQKFWKQSEINKEGLLILSFAK
jgi:ribosomal protein S17